MAMRKWILPVLCLLVLLAGCVKEPPATEASTTGTEAPAQTTEASTQTAESAPPTVPMDVTLPDSVVTPGEMPSAPEADAEIPPQPQPPVITE